MDLALALGGMTVGEMLERMTDREVDGWVAYAKKNGLPQRRQELYLAQVAQVQRGGAIADYMLKPATKEVEVVATAAEMGAVSGRKVHVLVIPKKARGA